MNKNNKFFRKNKTYLTIGFLFLVWGVFVFFAIIPSVKTLRNNFDLVQMKILETRINEEKLGKISDLKNSFEKVNKEKDNLNVIFSKDILVDLVRELEAIAQETGNEITISIEENQVAAKKIVEVKADGDAPAKDTKNSTKEEPDGGFSKILPTNNYFILKISLTGNYNNLIDFVDKLNNLKYYNSLNSFDISSAKAPVEDEKSGASSSGISIMGDGMNMEQGSSTEEKERLILNSNLKIIFYSLENNETK